MNVTTRFFLFLIACGLATPAISDPFQAYTPKYDEGPKAISAIVGLGTSHGGEAVGAVLVGFPSSGSGGYYTTEAVTLGGEKSYFGGAVLAIGDSHELWMTVGQMEFELSANGHPNISDKRFLEKLTHDRYEFMLFQKFAPMRAGLGVVMDRDIDFHYRDSTKDYTVTFDNASGYGLGVGFDIPFNNNRAAVRIDARYIKMTYKLFGEEYGANSIGYFLAVSF